MRNFRKMEPRRELAHVRGSILRKSTGQSSVPDFALLMMARGGRDLAANSCKAAAGEDIPIIYVAFPLSLTSEDLIFRLKVRLKIMK